ncbi:putative glycolipid-binding domain-containing protein [Paenibacillus profundus]|uniref:Glycolipid-binding domain-containing protein n=1 Tax=Paenibacillus profundus TaxID=1173085 RepID=A0ABS8YCX2_9BACL|nr:putative glycolipid-binding domain-containing protein [Paenibacillus profundus]MCE5169858.1 putative glycolipid-binding domain-containing protein [Paenibacillus profundus]
MKQTVIWKRLNGFGMEYCNISFETSLTIEGKVISGENNEKSFIDYTVKCDQEGNTSEVILSVQNENSSQTLQVLRDNNNRWTLNGNEIQKLSGLKDIDIGVTPSTNVLPIKRLNLAVGESATVTAAWIRFPHLEIQPLEQSYERINNNTYIYKSIKSGYTARLEVDSNGVVVEYEKEWLRI